VDWANEDYVRLYTRETADDLELSWEALSLWRAMMIRFDRAGLIPVRNGWTSIARLVRMPTEIVVQVGPELVRDGRVRMIEGHVYAPNFTEAQTTSKSDKARQKESRERRRTSANDAPHLIEITQGGHDTSRAVTLSHTASQNVTLPLLRSADPLQPVAEASVAPRDRSPSAPRRKSIPADWVPAEGEKALAHTLGLNVESEAAEFLTYWLGEGRPKKDWDMTFRNRLQQQAQKPAVRRANGRSQLELQSDRIRMLEEQERMAGGES
jgi:hypothetical protein